MMQLSKKIKITVCADGFVSIMFEPKHKRLGSALPFHSTDSIPEALNLIDKICFLKACISKKGQITIQPMAPNWAANWESNVDDIEGLAELFISTGLKLKEFV